MSNDSIFSGIYSPNSSSQVPTTPQYQAPSPSPQAPTTPQYQAPSPSPQAPTTPNTPSNNFGSGDNGIDFGEGL
ncbi:TPA: transporter [Streptococcus agalactiae]|nr:transporter [Streptococcus agalactiae]